MMNEWINSSNVEKKILQLVLLNQDSDFSDAEINTTITKAPKTKDTQHNAIVTILKKYWWAFIVPLLVAIAASAIEHKWFR